MTENHDEDPIMILLQPAAATDLSGECDILVRAPRQASADAARAWVAENFFGVEWLGDWICMAAGVIE